MKTYGAIYYDKGAKLWIITAAKPHVCIKLKALFTKIKTSAVVPFQFQDMPEVCYDLRWFMERYPLDISDNDYALLRKREKQYLQSINQLEQILLPDYKPAIGNLKPAYQTREYQLVGRDMLLRCKRILNGDDIGLGKTLIAILSFMEPATLPAAVVVETHMPPQWKAKIEEFTDLKVHLIQKRTPYNLPKADIYIFKYSMISGWVNLFQEKFFKSSSFDEVQALRRAESDRYAAAKELSKHADYSTGYSASPIYNYGDEMYNILDAINPGCLGLKQDFLREWTGGGKMVFDPDALGEYLKDEFLMLRRTRRQVKRELPRVNKIIQSVEFDYTEVESQEQLIKQLAQSVLSGSFTERGQASRELDMRLRLITGTSKARGVAALVKILLDSGEKVMLTGWHREVYEIWKDCFELYKPVFYTGSESGVQKERSKKAFIDGDTNLFIISNRSGAGLDGLQHVCSTIVHGELDWSPEVHNQLTGRLDRDGQQDPVTAYFPVVDYGSDPTIMQLLGVKASQSHGIMNPLEAPIEQYTDDSRIKLLAQNILAKDKHLELF